MSDTSIGYDFLLAIHIVTGLVGFGAIGMTGYWAGRARREPESEAVRRYFRPGVNWASRFVFLVPLAGVGLLYATRHREWGRQAWVLAGIALWFAAAMLATLLIWPAERRVQMILSSTDPDYAAVSRSCKLMVLGSAISDLIYVAAVWIMVAQPR